MLSVALRCSKELEGEGHAEGNKEASEEVNDAVVIRYPSAKGNSEVPTQPDARTFLSIIDVVLVGCEEAERD